MSAIKNYKAYWYNCDNIEDYGWGCGWRCIQMLLSQYHANNDIFTIGREVKLDIYHQLQINDKLPFMDITWIGKYMKKYENTYKIYTINNINQINEFVSKLETYFTNYNKLVVVVSSGAISLIGGVKRIGKKTYVYLIDPHVWYKTDRFPSLIGFGNGGKGWTDLDNILYKGIDVLNISEKLFIELNEPSFLFLYDKPKNN
jgi:hypothetical protein